MFVRKSALAASVLAGGMALGGGQALAATDILIGGGAVTGVYYQVALQACAIINKQAADKLNCVGRPALGSVFNVNAVSRGLLDFGVAQSDANYNAWNGAADWDGKKVENLRSVFSVHPETVLLVTRKDTGIKSVDDLKGKSVNIGNPGSGQRGNAMDVLEMYGLDPEKDLNAQGLQQGEASRALVDQKVDAFFYTVGNPSAAIEDPANSTQIDLVDINSDAIKKFVEERPYYVMTTIPAGTYRGVDEPTETYAVKATMVTSSDVSEETVYNFVKTFFDNFDAFKASNAAFKDLDPKSMLDGLTAPLHPGAETYFKEKGWM
ncbi:C4-dicarboxylate ABC transporter substrate-binding protein [Tistrella bauzanensis]|uniref:C4-dicarboxylate ABC transporter substrate-binding protein n=1 Tax=Tistrella bauzanensis TaxID=657419 RepID=A0ABQ1IMJ9_9PROT|nr:TAXI family TRAP transporter solute-binding subunit [Tistrella bauzanensis]GGB45961.1 C4-dicarboxylate ABC transporter substrate-binding protein [Tistrella bauzanensis]